MAEEGADYISAPGQVCFERVLPSEAHYYKTPPPPVCNDDPLCPLPLDAVSFTSKLWRNKNDLYVYFMKPHPLEDAIIEWALEWSRYAAVIFAKTTSLEKSDIRVDFNEGGSWSYVGTDATRIPMESFTMNLGYVDRPTVLHEFGHALGLVHEHQNPFKGGFEWNRKEVIRAMSGPPNYWDEDRIENNFFKRYKRKDVDGSAYDTASIMHYSFPREWIKGDGYPEGIGRNSELSQSDKEYIRRLYGPSRLPGNEKSKTTATPPTQRRPTVKSSPKTSRPPITTITTVTPSLPERKKPVTSLSPPRADKIYDVQVYEPHRGELSGPGAELLVRFHTSAEDRSRHTIRTHGDTDMIVALLGPDDHSKIIQVDDDSVGDRKNAKIVKRLMPDRDYFVQIQTFSPEGGKFAFSITAW